MLILIVGPYRSGTNDNPQLMQRNLNNLELVTLPLFRKGHLPIIGEWLALPLVKLAGSTKPGDTTWEEIQYPVAHRLLEKCDAVFRIPGASKGADEDIRVAREHRLPIYYRLEDVPERKQCNIIQK
jgi:hypothetical protein